MIRRSLISSAIFFGLERVVNESLRVCSLAPDFGAEQQQQKALALTMAAKLDRLIHTIDTKGDKITESVNQVFKKFNISVLTSDDVADLRCAISLVSIAYGAVADSIMDEKFKDTIIEMISGEIADIVLRILGRHGAGMVDHLGICLTLAKGNESLRTIVNRAQLDDPALTELIKQLQVVSDEYQLFTFLEGK